MNREGNKKPRQKKRDNYKNKKQSEFNKKLYLKQNKSSNNNKQIEKMKS